MATDKEKNDFLKNQLYKKNQELIDSQFKDLDEKSDRVDRKIDKLEDQILAKEECTQGALFGSIQLQIQENAKSIKKMYTWQAGVGISLLVFFLTAGVGWLRYVDNLSYEAQANKDKIEDIKKNMEERDKKFEERQKELKSLIEKMILGNTGQ